MILNTVAIISEYNPFHKGHKFQLDEVKRLFPLSRTVAIMSPNFVQRGAPAVFDKYIRGECAVRSGADLALSMPLVCALLSAEGFAEGGVRIAKKIGATHLAFGVENADKELIEKIANTLIDPFFDSFIKEELSLNPTLSYPTIRQKAIEKVLGKAAGNFIRTPNNILAVEYVKAIYRYAPEIEIVPIKRIGNAHRDVSESGEVLSASAIREIIANNGCYTDKLPGETLVTVANANKIDFNKYQSLLHSVIFSKKKEEILRYSPNAELTDVIFNNAQKYSCYNQFRASISRKKHPDTKIDRILTGILLGIGFDEYIHKEPKYATLLAMNSYGKEIISALRKEESITVFSRGADLKNNDCLGIDTEIWADRVYARCMESSCETGYFLKKRPFIYED